MPDQYPTKKSATRARILNEAARLLRVYGTKGVGVAEVMHAAGLTHGGFYAHFRSRDDLIDSALDLALREHLKHSKEAVARLPAQKAFVQIIESYLSEYHRDHPETGCALPALTSEANQLPPASRVRYVKNVQATARWLGQMLAAMGPPSNSKLAAPILAQIIGTLAVARAIKDAGASSRLLAESRAMILASVGIAARVKKKRSRDATDAAEGALL